MHPQRHGEPYTAAAHSADGYHLNATTPLLADANETPTKHCFSLKFAAPSTWYQQWETSIPLANNVGLHGVKSTVLFDGNGTPQCAPVNGLAHHRAPLSATARFPHLHG